MNLGGKGCYDYCMNLRVRLMATDFFSSWVTVSFSRWIPLHGISFSVDGRRRNVIRQTLDKWRQYIYHTRHKNYQEKSYIKNGLSEIWMNVLLFLQRRLLCLWGRCVTLTLSLASGTSEGSRDNDAPVCWYHEGNGWECYLRWLINLLWMFNLKLTKQDWY